MSIAVHNRGMSSAVRVWAGVKWAALVAGFLLAANVFTAPVGHTSALAGLACFAILVARMAQSEQHRARD